MRPWRCRKAHRGSRARKNPESSRIRGCTYQLYCYCYLIQMHQSRWTGCYYCCCWRRSRRIHHRRTCWIGPTGCACFGWWLTSNARREIASWRGWMMELGVGESSRKGRRGRASFAENAPRNGEWASAQRGRLQACEKGRREIREKEL